MDDQKSNTIKQITFRKSLKICFLFRETFEDTFDDDFDRAFFSIPFNETGRGLTIDATTLTVELTPTHVSNKVNKVIVSIIKYWFLLLGKSVVGRSTVL